MNALQNNVKLVATFLGMFAPESFYVVDVRNNYISAQGHKNKFFELNNFTQNKLKIKLHEKGWFVANVSGVEITLT